MFRKIFLTVLLLALLVLFHEKILTGAGSFLVKQNIPNKADAAVVLYTDTEIYPRLMEAAELYRQGMIAQVVINGNRKDGALRKLENNGYESSCKWYAEELSVLMHEGVPKDHVLAISAEDAFDTISEAEVVGEILVNKGMKDVIIATSKFNSRRAGHIWNTMYENRLRIYVAPARNDTFNPATWWKDSRQTRLVLSEYGAWIYYYWMKISD